MFAILIAMSPEERELLQRSIEVSTENNQILKKIQRTLKWQAIWGLIKIAVIIVPLVLGYVLLQPYLGSAASNFEDIRSILEASSI